jgi:hypothetical protein
MDKLLTVMNRPLRHEKWAANRKCVQNYDNFSFLICSSVVCDARKCHIVTALNSQTSENTVVQLDIAVLVFLNNTPFFAFGPTTK